MLYDSDRIKPITEEDILSRTTEYDIYSHYIGYKVPINTKFNSPLRKDDNPSFGLFIAKKTNRLLFKDLSTGESGNCFKFVKLLRHLGSYREALKEINRDLNLGILSKSNKGLTVKNKYKPSRTYISVKRKKLRSRDLEFWGRFGITRDTLRKFKVFPIKRVWVNGKMKSFIYTDKEPMYAFQIYNKFKIYRPYSKERFLGNCNRYDIQGLEVLKNTGHTLIITKSMKDVMALYELGYNAIAPNSENTMIPKEVISYLKKRFKHIVVLYDNDSTGAKGMLEIKKAYNLKCRFIPTTLKVKDTSDAIESYGKQRTSVIIKNIVYG